MNEQETYGFPEFLGTLVQAVVIYGVLGGIAGAVWAWATGLHVVLLVIIGALAGAVVGGFFGLAPANQRLRERRQGMQFMMFTMIGFPIILLALIGLVIGIVINVSGRLF